MGGQWLPKLWPDTPRLLSGEVGGNEAPPLPSTDMVQPRTLGCSNHDEGPEEWQEMAIPNLPSHSLVAPCVPSEPPSWRTYTHPAGPAGLLGQLLSLLWNSRTWNPHPSPADIPGASEASSCQALAVSSLSVVKSRPVGKGASLGRKWGHARSHYRGKDHRASGPFHVLSSVEIRFSGFCFVEGLFCPPHLSGGSPGQDNVSSLRHRVLREQRAVSPP